MNSPTAPIVSIPADTAAFLLNLLAEVPLPLKQSAPHYEALQRGIMASQRPPADARPE